MVQTKYGDIVKVYYTVSLEDGSVFDTNVGMEPLQFAIGSGQVIPGFDEAVMGMNPGESKTVKVDFDKAYGPRYEDLVDTVDRKQFPESWQPEIGQQYQMSQADAQSPIMTVLDVSEETVTIDANHPLAGKDLIIELKLIEIVQI